MNIVTELKKLVEAVKREEEREKRRKRAEEFHQIVAKYGHNGLLVFNGKAIRIYDAWRLYCQE